MIQSALDCIIIGAGPAGASAATVLAGHGRRVLVLEKEKFPRYAVGESLIPYCYYPLKRIGMVEKLQASSFPEKYSVQFVSQDGRASQPFYFNEHMEDKAASQTWQVTRSDFDDMLVQNAREKGATVLEQVKVTQLLEEGGRAVGVRAVDADGIEREWRAPVVLDASGRSALTLARQRWRIADPALNKIAIWTYFQGAKRDPGIDAGATTVAYVEEKNWFWHIPLKDDQVSVGIVGERDYLFSEGKQLETVFAREVRKNQWIQKHLEQGVQVDRFRTTGDFSYRSQFCAMDGLVLAGDAFAFLDPVFSSGVLLALKSGELAGDAIDRALAENNVTADQFRSYGEAMCHGIEAMRKLVYSFYDNAFSFKSVLMAHPHLRGDLTDCLIGHIDRDFDELFDAIRCFACLPDPISHGGPKERMVENRSNYAGYR
jgi:flavin-dependent dehydrogenase